MDHVSQLLSLTPTMHERLAFFGYKSERKGHAKRGRRENKQTNKRITNGAYDKENQGEYKTKNKTHTYAKEQTQGRKQNNELREQKEQKNQGENQRQQKQEIEDRWRNATKPKITQGKTKTEEGASPKPSPPPVFIL